MFNGKDMDELCDFAEYVLSVEDTDISFVQPYRLCPGGGVFGLAWKRLKRVLE